MNYDFFADRTDKLKILDFIFNETDLKVYDTSSIPEQDICEYRKASEIAEKFELENGGQFAVGFQLWSPRHLGKPLFRKIELNPKYCNGHKFRYSTEGWGLIQLYFGGVQNNLLRHSHIGHFNEKSAIAWESSNKFNGQADNWDWKEIQLTSRRLKYHIHSKLAIKKIGSFGVLPGAVELENKGLVLRY